MSIAHRIGLVVASGGLAVVVTTCAAPLAASATSSVAPPSATSSASTDSSPSSSPSGTPSGGGLTVGLGGLTISVGGGTVAVGPVAVNVPKTVAGLGKTVGKTVGGLTGGSTTKGGSTGGGSHPPSGGGPSTPPPPKHRTPPKPTSPPHPTAPGRTHPGHGSTGGVLASHARPAAVRHRAATGSTGPTGPVRSEPKDTARTPATRAHQRLPRPLHLKHRIAKLTDRAIGPIMRPGRTLLMLLASTTVLSILVLGLLVFVGRRPDPRVAASESRLRSTLTW